MKYQKTIFILTTGIMLLSAFATLTGILSDDGPGIHQIKSVRGDTVTIYGKGIYKHMSAEVAPQGIAQDYVTLFIGIPLMLTGLILALRDSLKGRFLLAGTLGYFFVTYLFYLVMGMYNNLFLVYTVLASFAFYALTLTLLGFDIPGLRNRFSEKIPYRTTGGFLIFNSIAIAFMWLSVVVPPLLAGSYPKAVEHYTTLIVQGLDLSILLPLSFISGFLLFKKYDSGYLLGPVYIIFLSILMTALTAKVYGMYFLGISTGLPPMVIIPLFNITAIILSVLNLKQIH